MYETWRLREILSLVLNVMGSLVFLECLLEQILSWDIVKDSEMAKKKTKQEYLGIENSFSNISTFYSFELFHSFCKLYKINNNANDTCS